MALPPRTPRTRAPMTNRLSAIKSQDELMYGPLEIPGGQVDHTAYDFVFYTDGGCHAKGKRQGGFGVVAYINGVEQCNLSMGWLDSTNNEQELSALVAAMGFMLAICNYVEDQRRQQYIPEDYVPELKVLFVSDSQYSLNALRKWADGWAKNGWKTQTGGVKNVELIKTAIALRDTLSGCTEVCHFGWVRAHNGEPGNEKADSLATAALTRALTEPKAYPRWVGVTAAGTQYISEAATAGLAALVGVLRQLGVPGMDTLAAAPMSTATAPQLTAQQSAFLSQLEQAARVLPTALQNVRDEPTKRRISTLNECLLTLVGAVDKLDEIAFFATNDDTDAIQFFDPTS